MNHTITTGPVVPVSTVSFADAIEMDEGTLLAYGYCYFMVTDERSILSLETGVLLSDGQADDFETPLDIVTDVALTLTPDATG